MFFSNPLNQQCLSIFVCRTCKQWLMLFSLCGAAGCATTSGGESPHGAEAQTPPRVYLEAAVLEVPREELAMLPPSVSELGARTDGSVLSAPHVLLEPEQRTVLSLGAGTSASGEAGAAPASWSLSVESSVLENGWVRVHFEIFEASDPDSKERAETTVKLLDRQVMFAPTELRAPAGKVVVLVAQPHVVRNRDDLHRILESKRNLPD